MTARSLRVKGGAALHGCTLGSQFTPDDPLKPGTTDVASAVWTPTAAAGSRTLTQEFTTAGKAVNDPRCTASLPKRSLPRGRTLTLRLRECRASRRR